MKHWDREVFSFTRGGNYEAQKKLFSEVSEILPGDFCFHFPHVYVLIIILSSVPWFPCCISADLLGHRVWALFHFSP